MWNRYGQGAEEEHHEEEPEVEVVAARGAEDDLVRHVARQHGPRAHVDQQEQFEDVDGRQARSEEHPHPDRERKRETHFIVR